MTVMPLRYIFNVEEVNMASNTHASWAVSGTCRKFNYHIRIAINFLSVSHNITFTNISRKNCVSDGVYLLQSRCACFALYY